MVLLAPLPGRSLEAGGDSRSREMTVDDRTRLTACSAKPLAGRRRSDTGLVGLSTSTCPVPVAVPSNLT